MYFFKFLCLILILLTREFVFVRNNNHKVVFQVILLGTLFGDEDFYFRIL